MTPAKMIIYSSTKKSDSHIYMHIIFFSHIYMHIILKKNCYQKQGLGNKKKSHTNVYGHD